MSLKNTSTDYGTIAKWIHWLTALLFLGGYVSVYYRSWFTEKGTPEHMSVLQLHLSFGVTVFVLVLLRIIWRRMSPPPEPAPGTDMEHKLAHLGHLALYAVMILMPVSGYLGTGLPTDFYFLFEIPKFEDTALFAIVVQGWMGLTFKEFEVPIDIFHKKIMGEWLLWMLIAGHAGAALYHHYVKKDDTLLKMTRR